MQKPALARLLFALLLLLAAIAGPAASAQTRPSECTDTTSCHSSAECSGGICQRSTGTCVCPQ
jgi:hypothetical protein